MGVIYYLCKRFTSTSRLKHTAPLSSPSPSVIATTKPRGCNKYFQTTYRGDLDTEASWLLVIKQCHLASTGRGASSPWKLISSDPQQLQVSSASACKDGNTKNLE
ncbi:uncharacterized protein ACBT57_012792 isoform 1-T1 [Dama dama]